MLEPKDYIIILLGILPSVLANILSYLFKYSYILHVLYLSIIAFLIYVLVIFCNKLLLVRKIGIKRIELNISNGTNTEQILDKVQHQFVMMGRSGSRFIEAKNFESCISRCDIRTPIRFLFLQPRSKACELLSKERNVSSNHASDILIASLRSLKKFKDNGYNIKVGFYDNPNYKPNLRVVIIDNNEAYISHYLRGQTGKESIQLVLEKNISGANNLFQAFSNFFESSWDIARKIEL